MQMQSTVPNSLTWGPIDSVTFINSLNTAYDEDSEVVHWKPNLSYGNTGSWVLRLWICKTVFIVYRAFAIQGSAVESIAISMKAAIVLPILLLQKPS